MEENTNILSCIICGAKLKPCKKFVIKQHLKSSQHLKMINTLSNAIFYIHLLNNLFKSLGTEQKQVKKDLIKEKEKYIKIVGNKYKCSLCDSKVLY
uniref:Uncharacterized protein n=1 Tax=Meloidogyne enterolobii TaxID=390850 RepID=A0A6V7XHE5_MELEN|nr:unnamed protein product [Meloidogyne enterolobii]